MSDQPAAPPPSPRPRRSPIMTALLIFVGIIMLLPGLCSIILSVVVFSDLSEIGDHLEDLAPLAFFFLIGVGGVALIVFAIRR
jgi:uncharacterized BrkB/YihY/UPF0761 family membrane protein